MTRIGTAGGTARVALALALCLGFGVASEAEIGTVDMTPSATLLLPYFEVDLSDEQGLTTLFFVTNTSAAAAVVHVTLWTDFGIPTFSFDLGLPGFGVRSVNIRDFFRGLTLSSGLGLDPVDFSEVAEALMLAHTGMPAEGTEECSGFNHGDMVARGYITIDNMNAAGAGFPGDAGYFVNGGAGQASNENVLWGEYLLADPTNNFAQGDSMVHIEAASGVFSNGDRTFYGTRVGDSAVDNREPLISTWFLPYRIDAEENADTEFVYWRDPRTVTSPAPCAVGIPSVFPLDVVQAVFLDRSLAPFSLDEGFPFALVCGRVPMNGASFPDLPEDLSIGQFFLNINLPAAAPDPQEVSQGFVSVLKSSGGRFSTIQQGTALDAFGVGK